MKSSQLNGNNKSEDFHNKSEPNINVSSSQAGGGSNKAISKSFNEAKNRLPFEDSLKIIKSNNNNSFNNNNDKPKNLIKQRDNLDSGENSSSSSSLESSDDNDPGDRLIRMEKIKKK